MKTSPCKDCEEREVGCHSTCEKYIEYKEIHEKETEAIKRERQKESEAWHPYSMQLSIQRKLSQKRGKKK